jgi:small subunit ribosomal protein S18
VREKKEGTKSAKFVKKRRRRVCAFCVGAQLPDYKSLEQMRKFITDRGKIAPRRLTGCCAKHQRFIAQKVKCARQAGVLPYVLG